MSKTPTADQWRKDVRDRKRIHRSPNRSADYCQGRLDERTRAADALAVLETELAERTRERDEARADAVHPMVASALQYQSDNWGAAHDDQHTASMWKRLLHEEIDEAEEASIDLSGPCSMIREVSQVAALGLAWFAAVERRWPRAVSAISPAAAAAESEPSDGT